MLWLPTREGTEPKLVLTIGLDVDSGGWLVEMTTPGPRPHDLVYSRIVVPMSAVEQDRTDEYVNELFQMHLGFLGV